ncbi:hypothetical protein D3C72_1395480 [compost metagenome]
MVPELAPCAFRASEFDLEEVVVLATEGHDPQTVSEHQKAGVVIHEGLEALIFRNGMRCIGRIELHRCDEKINRAQEGVRPIRNGQIVGRRNDGRAFQPSAESLHLPGEDALGVDDAFYGVFHRLDLGSAQALLAANDRARIRARNRPHDIVELRFDGVDVPDRRIRVRIDKTRQGLADLVDGTPGRAFRLGPVPMQHAEIVVDISDQQRRAVILSSLPDRPAIQLLLQKGHLPVA